MALGLWGSGKVTSRSTWKIIDSLGANDMKLEFSTSLNKLFNTKEFDKIKK